MIYEMYVKSYWEKDTRNTQISSSYKAYELGMSDFFFGYLNILLRKIRPVSTVVGEAY